MPNLFLVGATTINNAILIISKLLGRQAIATPICTHNRKDSQSRMGSIGVIFLGKQAFQ